MVIGIIGASISGLIAGKRLAKAGHDVTVIEKNQPMGGNLVTHHADGLALDYGVTSFQAKSKTFRSFVNELEGKEILRDWIPQLKRYDGQRLLDVDTMIQGEKQYYAPSGMQAVAKNLVRWVDVLPDVEAGGITYIGPDRRTKRAWMINLTDISVFECDAIIIATPAVKAYGLLMTSQDETPVKRITRHLDEVTYDPCFSLAVTYDREAPEWDGINCEDSRVRLISNESVKQNAEQAALVIQASAAFTRRHGKDDEEKVRELLLEEAAKIVDPWVGRPKSAYLHRWDYFNAQNPINEYFMELEMDDGPLALVGDYLGGTSVEDAYLSGYNLAEYWINKYEPASVI